MKIVLVTGGRGYHDWQRVKSTLDEEAPALVIQGCASGADDLAARWARDAGVMELRVPAPWKRHGKFAGPMRNAAMVTVAKDFELMGHDVRVIAFPGGRGTADCVRRAKDAGLEVTEVAS